MVVRWLHILFATVVCLALPFYSTGKVPSSRVDSLLHIIENTYSDSTHVLVYYQLGMEVIYADVERARVHFKNGLNLSKQLNYASGQALSLKGIGITFNLQGLTEKALESFIASAALYRQIGDQLGLSKALNNCGIVYKSIGNYDKALECYQQSLDIKVELQDRRGIATTYNNIGEIYTAKGNHQQAFSHYQSALDIFTSLGYLRGTARVISNLGVTYFKQGQYQKALTNYYRALEIEEAINDQHAVAESYLQLANAYYELNQMPRALEQINKSLDLAIEINAKKIEADAYKVASKIYEKDGQVQRALTMYRRMMTLNDSLVQKDMQQKIAEMQAKYELTQKESQIELLNRENELKTATIQRNTLMRIFLLSGLVFIVILASVLFVKNRQQHKANTVLTMQKQQISDAYDQIRNKNDEINEQHDDLLRKNHFIEQQKEEIHQQANELELQRDQLADRNKFIGQQNAELENLNRIKNKLFSIISHDLRSPLSSLSNMILLLNTDYFDDRQKLEETIKKLSIETKSTIDLLDNLLKWSKAQMEGLRPVPDTVNLHDLAEENLGLYEVIARDKGILLANDVPDMALAFADPDMIRLVFRNLVSNAIKFTDHGGKITISSERDNGTFKVNVTDTGIGILQADQHRIFSTVEHYSTRGTNNEKGTGIGLMLCKEFIRKNNGELTVNSTPGQGSTFSFTLQSMN